VDIVHHTHTDVGYTALPAVVRDLQKRYIDVAVDACESDPAFRWTVESLVGLDDWWKASTAARRLQLTALVQAGRMDVMGLPFNQTPFLNARQWRQMMSWIPETLWRSMNIRAAMQNDVNGFPRAGAIALLDRGIQRFLMGLNPDSGGPPFRRPSAFWWKMPDNRRLFVWLGEHYGSVMAYLKAARESDWMRTDEPSVRAAHADFVKRLEVIRTEGYAHERLILTFTNPLAYDNGGPVPSLAPFIAAWNRLHLQPSLRLATATQAVFDMEKATSEHIPEMQGEWTDWWANGDASAPREVAASRLAKRQLAAAEAQVFGAMPPQAQPAVTGILKDLCLFDEHTWGAAGSVNAPYSLNTQAQFVEKSDLAYRPMGMSEALLARRLHARIDPLAEGLYVVNTGPAEVSDWAAISAGTLSAESHSLVDVASGKRVE
jgi:alpha-mannosidase